MMGQCHGLDAANSPVCRVVGGLDAPSVTPSILRPLPLT